MFLAIVRTSRIEPPRRQVCRHHCILYKSPVTRNSRTICADAMKNLITIRQSVLEMLQNVDFTPMPTREDSEKSDIRKKLSQFSDIAFIWEK